MRARWGIIAALLAAVIVAPHAQADSRVAVELFRFQDPRIGESSGVASASYRNDLLFTHNDSGDAARFFAVDFTGKTVATYSVPSAGAVDWEDMARGPRQDGSPGQSLYFADIGNNFRDRNVLDIYEVAEPVVGVSPAALPVRSVTHVTYPDIRHDAETLLVHPLTGQLLIVAKEFHGISNVYALRNGALEHVATVNMLALMTPGVYAILHPLILEGTPGPLAGTQITGGDIGAKGDRIVLRTYLEAFEWPLFGSDYAASFAVGPARIELPPTFQGEAATYTNDGAAVIVTTEGVGGPVHRIRSIFAH
jgi:hypothetical protein